MSELHTALQVIDWLESKGFDYPDILDAMDAIEPTAELEGRAFYTTQQCEEINRELSEM